MSLLLALAASALLQSACPEGRMPPPPAAMPAPLPPGSPRPPIYKLVEEGLPAMEAKAANGDADAMFRLGVAYQNGLDVQRSYGTAMAWYRKAADAGDVRAMNNLGSELSDSSDRATCLEGVALLEKAALAGSSDAMNNISSMYGTGSALPLDRTEQQRWLLRAGEAGNPYAMLFLGLAFETGRNGVVKDRAKAIYWYRKAAEHNDDWRREAALDALKSLGQ